MDKDTQETLPIPESELDAARRRIAILERRWVETEGAFHVLRRAVVNAANYIDNNATVEARCPRCREKKATKAKRLPEAHYERAKAMILEAIPTLPPDWQELDADMRDIRLRLSIEPAQLPERESLSTREQRWIDSPQSGDSNAR